MYGFAAAQADTIVFAFRGTDGRNNWAVNIDMGHTLVEPIPAEMIVQDFLVKQAKVQINAGTNCGQAGTGRMRMNPGTSRKTLEMALSSIASALQRV
jgi:bifunctional pyridoxal-dependent enzyme with beta-cystathionase and maltose regulon repressor activities